MRNITTPMIEPKLKEVEIVASFSGTISSGQFENEKPLFSLKEVWTDVADWEFVSHRQNVLEQMCYEKFAAVERRSMVEKIKQARQDLRFYPIGNEFFPSVTSVIGWDEDFYMDALELAQYAARGTILHKMVEVYLKTGKWPKPSDLPEIYPEMIILKKGNLQLSVDDVDFPGFFKKYPFEVIHQETTVYNKEMRYAGRQDIKGKLDGKVTIFDIKTGSSIDKKKCFKQTTAYAHCSGNEDVEQMCIIHLNNKVQQGFSAPVIETDTNKYWHLFLKDRENFKTRFGV